MHSYRLNLFELDVAFTTEADPQRVQNARDYADNLYKTLKLHGNQLGRDKLLAILILGIADDLLQLKQQREDTDHRLNVLLQHIEKKEVPVQESLA